MAVENEVRDFCAEDHALVTASAKRLALDEIAEPAVVGKINGRWRGVRLLPRRSFGAPPPFDAIGDVAPLELPPPPRFFVHAHAGDVCPEMRRAICAIAPIRVARVNEVAAEHDDWLRAAMRIVRQLRPRAPQLARRCGEERSLSGALT